jgi:hypothetical protein
VLYLLPHTAQPTAIALFLLMHSDAPVALSAVNRHYCCITAPLKRCRAAAVDAVTETHSQLVVVS